MTKILIVEDDLKIANELASLLTDAGYESMILKDFSHALDGILEAHAHLILLDINIPYLNGEALLQDLRKKTNTPVIMVTSRASEVDEVLSRTYGADDYVTKPYNPTILLLRIQNLLKRSTQKTDVLIYKDALVYLQKGIIQKGNQEVYLTKNEMIIFNYLLNHPERIVSRDELMTDLWNNNEYINDNALSVNINRLRNKLKEIGLENAIETRKKLGYYLS